MNTSIPRLIGITGPRDAGKDTAGHHLTELGLMHNSLSDQLRAIASHRGLGHDSTILRPLGRELREQEGGGFLVRRALGEWQDNCTRYSGGLAVSGHFSPEEALEIQSHGGRIFFIDAPLTIRWKRELRRDRPGKHSDIKSFLERENIEMNGLDGPNTPYVNFARHLPGTIVIVNNTDNPNDFYRRLDEQLAIMPA